MRVSLSIQNPFAQDFITNISDGSREKPELEGLYSFSSREELKHIRRSRKSFRGTLTMLQVSRTLEVLESSTFYEDTLVDLVKCMYACFEESCLLRGVEGEESRESFLRTPSRA